MNACLYQIEGGKKHILNTLTQKTKSLRKKDQYYPILLRQQSQKTFLKRDLAQKLSGRRHFFPQIPKQYLRHQQTELLSTKTLHGINELSEGTQVN